MLDFKEGSTARVIGKDYTSDAGIFWHPEMDKTIGLDGVVRNSCPNEVSLDFGDDAWTYHPNDLRLIPQTESMDKKELEGWLQNNRIGAFGPPRLGFADIADRLHESFDITPKTPAQPKPEPEDWRKGGERRGEERRVRETASPETRCAYGYRRAVHPLGRRSGNGRRQEKTECNCSYPVYCNAGARVKQLEKQLADSKANSDVNHAAHLRTIGDVITCEARVKELEANYDESERRVDFYKVRIKELEETEKAWTMYKMRKDVELANSESRVNELEKGLGDAKANHNINHAAHFETLSNVARLEKTLEAYQAECPGWLETLENITIGLNKLPDKN